MRAALVRNAEQKDPAEGIQRIGRHTRSPKALQDVEMVTVSRDVRAANPSHQISNTPIEVKQSRRNHRGAVGVDSLFVVPVRLVASERIEVNVTIFAEKLEELGNGGNGRPKIVPVGRAIKEEARFPQGKEDVAEARFDTETLGRMILTKWLIQFGLEAGTQGLGEFVQGGGRERIIESRDQRGLLLLQRQSVKGSSKIGEGTLCKQ